jgi:hypothetical protein
MLALYLDFLLFLQPQPVPQVRLSYKALIARDDTSTKVVI